MHDQRMIHFLLLVHLVLNLTMLNPYDSSPHYSNAECSDKSKQIFIKHCTFSYTLGRGAIRDAIGRGAIRDAIGRSAIVGDSAYALSNNMKPCHLMFTN